MDSFGNQPYVGMDAGCHVGHLMTPAEREFRIWQLDQRIVRRGIYVDEKAARHALEACENLERVLNKELTQLTGGAVETGSQAAKIADFCGLDNCQADTVEKELKTAEKGESRLSDRQVRVLGIRRALSKASTKKLKKIILWRDSGGRVRQCYQYHGAHTGRPTGRGPQPTNLLRPSIKHTSILADLWHGNELDAINFLYKDISFAAADALRAMFTAAPGHELYAGDFKSVEAVVTAGLANERWKLDAFQAVLDGKGFVVDGVRYDDAYCAAATKILGRHIAKEEDSEGRQIGKMGELAFGFQGGVGAWHGFDPDTTYTDDEINGFKDGWRAAHPRIVRSWHARENAMIECIEYGEETAYRDTRFRMTEVAGQPVCQMVLANDKTLDYFRPRLIEDVTPWGEPCLKIKYAGHRTLPGTTARVWSEHCDTYGGKITENDVQATAREIAQDRMLAVEDGAGMPIVMHTYDEVVVEMPRSAQRYDEFLEIMGEMPIYAQWPIGVDGWRGRRYRK